MVKNNSKKMGIKFAGVFMLGLSYMTTPTVAQTEAETTQTPTEAVQVAKKSAADDITFTSWTGPYMRSQMLGFVRPYEDKTGSRVFVEHYSGGIDEIRDQVESANVTWDVVDLTQADSLRACQEGLLEKLDDIELPNGVDGSSFKDDFVDGALNECGIGVIVWATAFGYNKELFAEDPPKTISDFFDTKKYPGRRAIRNDPSVIMEWALIADGIAPKDVYGVLETNEGVQRALKKMDSIRPGLRFWSKGLEPARMLNEGEVVMSMTWATTGASQAVKPDSKFNINWDGRVIELDLFGIPKGARNKEAAIEFIKYASSSEALANMVKYLPNGPTRKSSIPLLSEETLAQIPNGPAYESLMSIQSDAEWWSKNYDRIKEAYDAWLVKVNQQGAAGTVR